MKTDNDCGLRDVLKKKGAESAAYPGMLQQPGVNMQLENPRISAMALPNNHFTIVISAIEVFTQDELNQNFEFEDRAEVWEWDDSDHDHLANFSPIRWRPASLREFMEWTWSNIPGDTLDTELGGEEIRAKIYLKNVTSSSPSVVVHTPILPMSPD